MKKVTRGKFPYTPVYSPISSTNRDDGLYVAVNNRTMLAGVDAFARLNPANSTP